MDNVSKTLYIPLYGRAYVSRKGMILADKTAEKIWRREGFPLKGKAASKWLAYTMAMRARVFDRWTKETMAAHPGAVVLHLGCGLDSRCQRIDRKGRAWFDLDVPEVIEHRRRFFREGEGYRMLPADLRQEGWIAAVTGREAIVVMEGLSMYFRPEELSGLLKSLGQRFEKVWLLMDCYTTFGARASRFRNPIHQVGVHRVYGLEDPETLAERTGYSYNASHSMTPQPLIAQLKPMEQAIFRSLFAGTFARKLYQLYEFQKP